MTTALLQVVAVWQREKVGVGLAFNEHPEPVQIGEEKEQKMGEDKEVYTRS